MGWRRRTSIGRTGRPWLLTHRLPGAHPFPGRHLHTDRRALISWLESLGAAEYLVDVAESWQL